ncbi:MAG: hypothetical protein CMQ41_02305 [Gammaproteobacteria bacterium]|nr:hypothetical protein [Gammaproteobacteria bacterium]
MLSNSILRVVAIIGSPFLRLDYSMFILKRSFSFSGSAASAEVKSAVVYSRYIIRRPLLLSGFNYESNIVIDDCWKFFILLKIKDIFGKFLIPVHLSK